MHGLFSRKFKKNVQKNQMCKFLLRLEHTSVPIFILKRQVKVTGSENPHENAEYLA